MSNHSLSDAIVEAERELQDAESEIESAERDVREAKRRLRELQDAIVHRQQLRSGDYFEIDGVVFCRTQAAERDFGGAVGRCFRAHRQRLAGRLEIVGDAEWIKSQGTARRFKDAIEAKAFLALDEAEEESCCA